MENYLYKISNFLVQHPSIFIIFAIVLGSFWGFKLLVKIIATQHDKVIHSLGKLNQEIKEIMKFKDFTTTSMNDKQDQIEINKLDHFSLLKEI